MPNLGTFKHGVSWADVPTSVISPVTSTPGVNVVIGSAPLHLNPDGRDLINKPRIYNTYEEAVAEMGYSTNWDKYDICEHMDAAFVEFGVAPVIYIAVNDPEDDQVAYSPTQHTLVNGQANTGQDLIAWSLLVKNEAASATYVKGTDYLVSRDDNNKVIITRLSTGDIPDDAIITVSGYTPGGDVDATDIIGGIDVDSGAKSGLEVIEDVFPMTSLVPGIILCPKFSSDPLVAAAMAAKCDSINGCFTAICVIDVDTDDVTKVQDVDAWKQANNITSPRQTLCFGMPALVGNTATKKFHFATQQGALMQWVDANRGNNLPYHSPSNKSLRMNALLLADDSELSMNLLDANMLNGQGVVTALNFLGGWKSWGNRTAAYPANSDVKDMFINVRRMFDYIGNSIVLTLWQKVDEPGNRRLIDAIVNSLQLWLDGLTNTEGLLGARLEFRHDENPTTELLNGHYVFHVFIAAPTPAEWLDFRVEYWVPYITNLFPSTT